MPPGSIPPRPDDTFISAPCLARRLGLTLRAVTVFLARLAERCPDIRTEVNNPRRGEPRNLYRVEFIWDAVVRWMKAASAEDPPKTH